MKITPNEFYELQKKYPKCKVNYRQILSFEDRVDMLLVHFRGKGYEVWFPPNTLNKKKTKESN